MDESKYKLGEKMSEFSMQIIDTFTNLDPNSLSPYQETMMQGMGIIITFLILILLFK